MPISLLVSLITLFCLNCLMVTSLAPKLLGKQLLMWLIGVILFFFGRQINLKQISPYKWRIFAVCCLLLVLPIILNQSTRGSRRWINLGFTTLQPSELVKPPLMMVLAATGTPLFHFLPILITILQPDLGSAISLFILSLPVIVFNKKILFFSLAGLLFLGLISPLIWQFGLHEYQRHRILTFIDPYSDPLNKGYNVIQSKIAIGSGGIFGKGYRKGTQGQLLYLPEKHTDFVFAATAEELGLVGVGLILFAYYTIISQLFRVAFSQNSQLYFLFTLGITVQIWFQVFVNVGMNLGLLPVTGIPLPFLSIGGSSIISLLFSLGVIFSI